MLQRPPLQELREPYIHRLNTITIFHRQLQTLRGIAFISPYLIPINSKHFTISTSWQLKHSTFLPIDPHFPHLCHLVTLQYFVDFSCVCPFHGYQPRLRLQLKSETYSQHSRISMIEFFAERINGFQPWTIFTKSSILVVWLGSRYLSETVSYC